MNIAIGITGFVFELAYIIMFIWALTHSYRNWDKLMELKVSELIDSKTGTLWMITIICKGVCNLLELIFG